MTFVSGLRLKGLTLCLTAGLAALPMVVAGSHAAQAQWGPGGPPRVVLPPPPQPPSPPPQLPQTLSPGSLTPACCVTAAPPVAAPAPAAAAPARRN
jgi:hypothetical protein